MSNKLNLVDVLSRRQDSTSSQYRESIEAILENRFINDHDHFDYDLLPDMVLSTIAISISSNGSLVASTHGDHTVKIFQHDTGKFIHSFQGHPRTPWTVKFHPSDANYVASGCLGCEVRVWDIRNRICRSYIRLGYSIISLSFQPNDGAHIGIASGPQLLLWDWRHSSTPEEDDVMYRAGGTGSNKGLNQNKVVYPNQEIEPVLVHSRNIRAIIFHPLGTLAFAAAPDPPRQANAAPSPCRLYSIECPLIGNNNNVQKVPSGGPSYVAPSLDTMPTLIPQIHLYSDGGLDISADGRFIFACAMLATKKAPRSVTAGVPVPGTLPIPVRHSAASRERADSSSICSSNSTFTLETEDDSKGSSDSDTDTDAESYEDALNAFTANSSGRGCSEVDGLEKSLGNMGLKDEQWRRGAPGDGRPVAVVSTHRTSDLITRALQLNVLASASRYALPEERMYGWDSFFSHGRSIVLPEAAVAAVVTDGSHLMFLADPLSTPYPPDWSVEERLCLFKISVQVEEKAARPSENKTGQSRTVVNVAVNDPKTVTTIGSLSVNDTNSGAGVRKDDDMLPDPYSIPNAMEGGLARGGTENVLYKLSDVEVRDPTAVSCPACPPRVHLVQSKHLPGSLMRAVTSMKLSPSGRLGLIGYGVRVNDNVMHHTNRKVACEILDLTKKMSTSCIMSDDVDEVNIAQFHPIPGSGILYGTKRGKVRVFCSK
mmetsp:Transcript_11759/g.21827  ORF Transcript_11759/g.21827 Transcript_11759/m.21827 type:complete len:712 (+) Transcript_11759:58-2193(+)